MLPYAPSPGEKQPEVPQPLYAPGVTKTVLAVAELEILTVLAVLAALIVAMLVVTVGVIVLRAVTV
jgi:hypothetical protein